jgi:hypothetical protein
MANPTCTVAQFTSSAIAPCLKKFDRTERLSLLIYFNALELAAIGGTNYNAQLGHAGTLMTSAECYKQELSKQNPVVIPSIPYLVIAYNNAINAGASVATDLTAAIACNKDFTLQQKAAQALLLACSLGSHKAYPQ